MELRLILEILYRRRWFVINSFAAVFLTIVIGTLLITPWYDSTAKVLLRNSAATASTLKSIGLSDTTSQSSSTLSDTDRSDYLALAVIRPVAEKTIAELNLKRMRTRARLMNAIPGLKTTLRFLGVDVNATEEVMTAEELLASAISSRIFPRPNVSVEQQDDTDIITIKGVSPDPEQAMKIANSMANNFIQDELKRVTGDYAGAKAFIDMNIIKAKAEYLGALDEVKEIKEKEGFVNLDTETSTIIQKISDTKKAIEDNRLSIVKSKTSISNIETQLKSLPTYSKSSEQFKDNEMVLSLKNTQRDLYLSLAETKTKYTKDHPLVVDIENKIAQSKELLQKEVIKIFGTETVSANPVYQDLTQRLASSYADLAGYEGQGKSLPAVLGRYEAEMMKLPNQVTKYAKLQLAATVTQDIYNSLLKYQYQIGMAESATLSNIYLVEPAVMAKKGDSNHKKPSLGMNIIVAIILGSMFSIGGALFIDYLDDTIKSAKDIKAISDLTFLGSIFKLKKKDQRLISPTEPRSLLNEFIRTIRNSLKYASLDSTLKRIMVTSVMEKEGKSFFVANLAISAANEGKKVLVIDADLRRPGINNYFLLPKGIGLTNYMVGDSNVNDIQLKTDIEGLHVILTGPIPPDPGKLVESTKLHKLIEEMADVYDLIIVDTPPLMAASDALVLAGHTDGSILLVQSGRVAKNRLHDAIELFNKAKINLLGIVLNQTHSDSSAYYYYDGYK